jgi:hypothetical protein
MIYSDRMMCTLFTLGIKVQKKTLNCKVLFCLIYWIIHRCFGIMLVRECKVHYLLFCLIYSIMHPCFGIMLVREYNSAGVSRDDVSARNLPSSLHDGQIPMAFPSTHQVHPAIRKCRSILHELFVKSLQNTDKSDIVSSSNEANESDNLGR